ncbi:hypothetical protein AVEN_98254-1 [Araneus ventricosus]|uniref:Uncharacterized protein n=1 Tax=Araneus ventricosus TaxID=182803 RepID=A0A4Y2LFB7_ARAVE|nr:hypothetical protein AVEN_158472-1 [Araneus ventricosus]GBN12559.1 hypothetical protein AVEN_62574-1 [Araneus ventricosus]GBN12787.1 hypothetical protein AVEN_14707-1 [Araneus ventricosus]GBN12840.1 hypothetical protein AVEN_98254-1 [Araneus ventricosus]
MHPYLSSRRHDSRGNAPIEFPKGRKRLRLATSVLQHSTYNSSAADEKATAGENRSCGHGLNLRFAKFHETTAVLSGGFVDGCFESAPISGDGQFCSTP